MKDKKIIIVKGEIRTGKSAMLFEWAKRNNSTGFITPTVDGKKVFYNISHASFHDYELDYETQDSISIGNYILSSDAFKLAAQIANDSLLQQHNFFILDEVGKLEINGRGHHDILQYLLKHFPKTLILIIREQLVGDVIRIFNISNCLIMNKEEFNNFNL